MIDDGFLLERTKKGDPLCWRERVPFYRQKRDRFTSERVKVRMLLGFVTHATGYKIMVGAYNTVGCRCRMSDAPGRLRCLLQKWHMSVPANTVDA